jgi:hypothetical protein
MVQVFIIYPAIRGNNVHLLLIVDLSPLEHVVNHRYREIDEFEAT